jgi:hypothetical protein
MAPGHTAGRKGRAAVFGAIALLVLAFPALDARAEGLKLEVVVEKASVHLEPTARSPVVETLAKGAVVTLSSAVKFRTNWFYVAFCSSRSGRRLSGYVLDGLVRKLNSSLRIVDLSAKNDEILEPNEIDLTATSLPQWTWGRTKASILEAEGRPSGNETANGCDIVSYRRDVIGKKCLLSYVFADRKLVGVRLHLLEKYADKNRYIADYQKIRDFLNEKIGEPRFDNVVWRDRARAEQDDNWGAVLCAGGLAMSSEWVFQGTGLRLSLTGENNEVLFVAEINDVKAKNPASF